MHDEWQSGERRYLSEGAIWAEDRAPNGVRQVVCV
jgi:hypothetical protein